MPYTCECGHVCQGTDPCGNCAWERYHKENRARMNVSLGRIAERREAQREADNRAATEGDTET